MTVPLVSIALDDRSLALLADLVAERVLAIARSAGPAEDRFLEAKDAAHYLGFPSVDALRKRAVPQYQDQPNGKVYYRRSELDAWRETHRFQPASTVPS